MTETIMAAVPAATTLAAVAAGNRSSMLRQGQSQAVGPAGGARQADRRMAGCVIQPECRGGRTMSATAASNG